MTENERTALTAPGGLIETLPPVELLPRVIEKRIAGWRLCQICAVTLKQPENGGVYYELSYSFAREYELHTFRLVLPQEEEIPSISQVYDCAFLYENEMRELFGVRIQHIATDMQDKLYRIDTQTPFGRRK